MPLTHSSRRTQLLPSLLLPKGPSSNLTLSIVLPLSLARLRRLICCGGHMLGGSVPRETLMIRLAARAFVARKARQEGPSVRSILSTPRGSLGGGRAQ